MTLGTGRPPATPPSQLEPGGLVLVLAVACARAALQEGLGPVGQPELPGVVDVAAGNPAGPLDRRAEGTSGGGDRLLVAQPPAAVAERISAISPSQARSIMSSTSSNP